jgi:type I restriction enzyme S subunit
MAITERTVAGAQELFGAFFERLITTSAAWDRKPLADISENLDGRRRPVTKKDRVPGEVPYYGASGVVDRVRNYLFDEPLLLVSEDGANLLTRTYPIAFAINGKTWVNNHAHVLRFSDEKLQRYVEYYLNSISLEPYVSGMAQPKLNQKALNGITVPIPPSCSTGQIVGQLDKVRDAAKALYERYRRKLDALAELKQALLARAFSGELTGEEARAE